MQPPLDHHQTSDNRVSYDLLIDILRKGTKDFSQVEQLELFEMMKRFKFFTPTQELKANAENFYCFVAQYLNYEFVPKGKFIYHEGDPADKVYIILRGSAREYEMRSWNEIQSDLAVRSRESVNTKTRIEDYEIELTKIQAQRDAVRRRLTLLRVPERMKQLILSKLGKYGKGFKPLGHSITRTATLNGVDSSAQQKSLPQSGVSVTSMEQLEEVDSIDGEDESNTKTTNLPQDDAPLVENELRMFQELSRREKKFLSIVRRAQEKHDEELFRQDEKHRQRYFLNEIFKYKLSRSLFRGDSFGESALGSVKHRETTLLAADNVHLVTLTKHDLKTAMNDLKHSLIDRAKFFKGFLPDLEETEITNFCYYFSERSLKLKEIIYNQGDKAEMLYIVKSGEVKLQLEIPEKVAPRTKSERETAGKHLKKSEVKVSSITEGQFFGEEVLLGLKKRQFTALCTVSKTVLFKLSLYKLQSIKVIFPKIYNALQQAAKAKSEWKLQRLGEELSLPPNKILALLPSNQVKSPQNVEKVERQKQKQLTATQKKLEGEFGVQKDTLSVYLDFEKYREKYFRKTFENEIKIKEQIYDVQNQAPTHEAEEDRPRDWFDIESVHMYHSTQKFLKSLTFKKTSSVALQITPEDKLTTAISVSDMKSSPPGLSVLHTPKLSMMSSRRELFLAPSRTKSPELSEFLDSPLKISGPTSVKKNDDNDAKGMKINLYSHQKPLQSFSKYGDEPDLPLSPKINVNSISTRGSASHRPLKSLDTALPIAHAGTLTLNTNYATPVKSLQEIAKSLPVTARRIKSIGDALAQKKEKLPVEPEIVNKHVHLVKTGKNAFRERKLSDVLSPTNYFEHKLTEKFISTKHNLFRKKPSKDVVLEREYTSSPLVFLKETSK